MRRMGTPTQPVKKPHQHHVWQEYLRSWADADGAVFCLQDGRVFSTGAAVLGVGKDEPSPHGHEPSVVPLDVLPPRVHVKKSLRSRCGLNECVS